MERQEHVELFVAAAHEPQTIECPVCAEEIVVLITRNKRVTTAGVNCPECHAKIAYRYSRTADTKDTTEQTTLGGGADA